MIRGLELKVLYSRAVSRGVHVELGSACYRNTMSRLLASEVNCAPKFKL